MGGPTRPRASPTSPGTGWMRCGRCREHDINLTWARSPWRQSLAAFAAAGGIGGTLPAPALSIYDRSTTEEGQGGDARGHGVRAVHHHRGVRLSLSAAVATFPCLGTRWRLLSGIFRSVTPT